MTGAPIIPLSGLAASVVFLAMGALVARRYRLPLVRELAIGGARAALQLFAVGYALTTLFAHEQSRAALPLMGLVLISMLLAATFTAAKRVRHAPAASGSLAGAAALAVGAGSVASLVPIFVAILPGTLRENLEARIVVPLAGMMVANAMNVVAQIFERYFAAMANDRARIEAALSLGASPAQATMYIARDALHAALLPTLNGLATVGLVALPGMMTGQILSGAAPSEAIRYQLVVMYALVAVAAVAGGVALTQAQRLAFDDRDRLRRFPEKTR